MADALNAYATTLADQRQTVTTAGTRVQLTSSVIRARQVDITALHTNTGIITVGSSTVVAAAGTRRGTPLNPGDTYTGYNVDLSQVYLDSTVNGEGVSYSYIV